MYHAPKFCICDQNLDRKYADFPSPTVIRVNNIFQHYAFSEAVNVIIIIYNNPVHVLTFSCFKQKQWNYFQREKKINYPSKNTV